MNAQYATEVKVRAQRKAGIELLHVHDVQGDDRVLCLECRHYRPGRCGNRRAAGLTVAEVGRDLAALLRRCTGFSEAM